MNSFQRIAVVIAAMGLVSNAAADEIVRGDGFILTKSVDGVRVTEKGEPVLFYQSAPRQLKGEKPYRRAHYVHPLYDLSGNVITEDFPKDHLHHRGIFWAWHQVLASETSAGDAWICRDFDWAVQNVKTTVVKNVARIHASAVWKSSKLKDDAGQEIPIARDDVEIRIWPRGKRGRAIDFEIRLTALVPDLRIGGSDDTKGYGGFSTRIRMPDDLKFISESGPIQPTKNAVTAANWMRFQSSEFSYAIFASRKNPGDPRQWILRQKRSMQNSVYPGQKPVPLPPDKPSVLRYRIVILEGGDKKYDLSELQSQFEETVQRSSE